jgi:hypothetical protein
MVQRTCWYIACLGVAGLAGCAAPGPSPLDFTVRTVAGQPVGVMMDVAEQVLSELGYAIAVRDPASGRLQTAPVEVAPVGASAGPSLRSGRLRRIAQIRVTPAPEGVSVHCNVSVQQQMSEAHRWLAFDRTSSDMPGQTAIERDAATTVEQNTVWETIRRDKAAERAILAAILDRVGDVAPQPSPQPGP